MNKTSTRSFRCGVISLVGCPNVGKSTLLNRLVGQKLSIVSRKPQTTRWRLLGIKNTPHYQAVFVDTPGFQHTPNSVIERYMRREMLSSLSEIDVVFLLIEAMNEKTLNPQLVQHLARHQKRPVLIINKIDKISRRERLLPLIKRLSTQYDFREIIPISAKKNTNLDVLDNYIAHVLPESGSIYSPDQVTDRGERFFAAEFIREKLTRRLGKEIPYHLAVTIEGFEKIGKLLHVVATIWVETSGQKKIVIGSNGNLLKQIGEEAREDMQAMFHSQVYLQTWVKVRKKWADSEHMLKTLGYYHNSA